MLLKAGAAGAVGLALSKLPPLAPRVSGQEMRPDETFVSGDRIEAWALFNPAAGAPQGNISVTRAPGTFREGRGAIEYRYTRIPQQVELLGTASASPQALAGLPSQVDPRGLLTFGIGGVSLMIIAWLMARDPIFPKGLANLGYVLALLLVVLYFGRLIILFPTHPVMLVVTLLSGFLIGPAWYGWLGIVLRGASPLR